MTAPKPHYNFINSQTRSSIKSRQWAMQIYCVCYYSTCLRRFTSIRSGFELNIIWKINNYRWTLFLFQAIKSEWKFGLHIKCVGFWRYVRNWNTTCIITIIKLLKWPLDGASLPRIKLTLVYKIESFLIPFKFFATHLQVDLADCTILLNSNEIHICTQSAYINTRPAII